MNPTQAHSFNRFVLSSATKVAMPIAAYPGLHLTGASIREVVTNPQAQFEAQAALQARYKSHVLLSAMDLSAEAEAFGCTLYAPENEVPSVTGRLVTSLEQAKELPIPQPGDKRTAVHLEAVTKLRQSGVAPLVLGGCIGPFSLAARLVGVSEAMELTMTDPALIHQVLEKCVGFLTEYGGAFRRAGANGLIMAEPAAGLLSPRALAQFSSAYIRTIGAALQDGEFAVILHNCAARLAHLQPILDTGLKTYHFGAPMDLPLALTKVPSDVVVCGNLDPAGVFCGKSPEEVESITGALCNSTAASKNHVVSSGCDLPPNVPLANLDAFYRGTAS